MGFPPLADWEAPPPALSQDKHILAAIFHPFRIAPKPFGIALHPEAVHYVPIQSNGARWL